MMVIGILVSGIAAFMLGALWYGLLFSKAWVKASGVDVESSSKNVGMYFFMTLVFEVIFAIVLYMLIQYLNITELSQLIVVALFVGSLSVLSAAKNYLFERRPISLFIINESYKFLIPVLMVLILNFFI